MPSPDRPTDLLPRRIHFRDRPEVTLVRPCLGLTLYVDEPAAWADHLAAELFERYLQAVDPTTLRWFQTSGSMQWRSAPDIGDLRAQLPSRSLLGRVRHLWSFRCADDPGAPSAGFVYREVDPRREPPCAYVQMFLPFDSSSDELLALAIEVGQRFTLRSGIGGYCFAWNPRYPRNAFHAVHALCRRFRGIDVQHPDQMSWYAQDRLPGVGWLTLVGSVGAVDREALRARVWSTRAAVLALGESILIRAGDSPSLGDMNQVELPSAQAEVAQVLAPSLVRDETVLPGRFEEDGTTRAWRERFTFPEAW